MKKLFTVCLLIGIVLTGCSNNTDKQKDGSEKPDPNTLVVATFNIDAKAQPDVQAQRKLLEDNNVDIFGIQEVDNKTIRNSYDVAEKFKNDVYTDVFYSNAIEFQGGEYGIATVSKHPFTSSDTMELFSGLFKGEELLAELKEAYKNFDPEIKETADALDAVDAKGPIEPRVLQRSVISVNGKDVAFYNTHLSWEDIELRKQQLEFIAKTLDEDKCEYKIVVGDFNVDQNTRELDLFKDNYKLSNGKDGIWHDTYTGVDESMNLYHIDNVIVSKNIKIKSVKMVDTDLSDHNPLVVELELN
ncbi:endonuclease/exonuclease/phosphatase family metal-dependent hydrolase [Breznakia blatticola]|uniref:Endonuclease/exonuclease/phosphatase family metal-dependent hydrolase n=1 Tax=Breznakia blatticola TaxID=1754012 RepID=A0A4R7ZGN1_9FIRM|nr:endonuclease/exonuclease/phosphatase family protein [Breznakia blatticola]TDW16853.1 endonuclease/exonuclease/phosphatase family metal-dependent hydrolase [Breznakia blatticola]